MLYLYMITLFSVVYAYEKDMTVMIEAGKTTCFFQKVMPNEIIDIEYQVIDATHGELDISFQLMDPVGLVIVADYKKPENNHRHTASLEGEYRLCFDNSFSTFSTKTVFFDLMVETEDSETDKDYDDEKEMELGNTAESYTMRVRDITSAVARVRDSVAAARRMQESHAAHEARDRNLAEALNDRVLRWSMWQVVIMLSVGFLQVLFVRSLFEDRNGVTGLKKLLPNSLR